MVKMSWEAHRTLKRWAEIWTVRLLLCLWVVGVVQIPEGRKRRIHTTLQHTYTHKTSSRKVMDGPLSIPLFLVSASADHPPALFPSSPPPLILHFLFLSSFYHWSLGDDRGLEEAVPSKPSPSLSYSLAGSLNPLVLSLPPSLNILPPTAVSFFFVFLILSFSEDSYRITLRL